MSFSRRSLLLAMVPAFIACGVTASHGEEEKSARHVRLLAMGDMPPFRQEVRDGVRYEIDPPPGSLPPPEVIPVFVEEAAAAMTLRLGRLSAPFKVPAIAGTLVLKEGADASDASPWMRRDLPETGDFLVFLWRNPSNKTWKDPLSLAVPDGPQGHPAGMVRITNLFPLAIRLLWDGETFTLAGGRTVLRRIAPGTEVPLQVLTADSSGTMKRYYSGAVTQNPGERGFVTIYRADGLSPRRPLKVSIFREPVPKVVPKPPADGKP